MIRRPPRSTLFPYTTPLPIWISQLVNQRANRLCTGQKPAENKQRSEEHTSELQSRRDLVCRLLLEKKNTRRPTSPEPNQKHKLQTNPTRAPNTHIVHNSTHKP